MKKKLFSLFIVLIFVLTSFSSFNTSRGIAQANDPTVKVEQAVLDEMLLNGSASYWIQFKNSVDLSPAYTMNWSDRGWFVYETLQKQAEVTQAQVSKYLTSSKVEFNSYWINNSILVTSSTINVLNDILKFEGVESIGARKIYILYEPDTSAALLDNGINAIEPNLTHINADDVWALGIDGTGLVVANIDTGVRYSHEALVGQYRGNLGGSFDHNYNWFNPDDLGDNVPRDGNGHGTHTMGTMIGDDGGSNQIGIAPGAEWIACAGCPDGGCTDSALLGCGQFIAAPHDLTGANANPDLRPNAVNNSWGDCGTTYNSWYSGPINAWLAAGIYPIFSNGNASNCYYPEPPGLNTVGNPARSGNVTGVGSSGEQNGQYATHSNWGPTDNPDTVNPTDGFDELKPQVIAPGVDIRSSTPGSDTEYQDGWDGTSMSAPHVTGLVALIWQASPCLIGNYAVTENLIESTAVDIIYDDGSTLTPSNFPNYATGWGEIDALAAVNMASGMCAMGTLEGTVTTDGFAPLEGAEIFADNGAGYTKTIYSATNGGYSTSLAEGTYSLTASKYGYQSQTVTGVVIYEDATTFQDFIIPPLGMSLVSGNVYDGGVAGVGAHGYPLYSSIHISAPGFDETIYTDPFTGYYEIELLDSAPYTFEVRAVPQGYSMLSEVVTPTGATYSKDFALMVGPSCSAPGYRGSGVIEHFETGFLPDEWGNYDYMGNGQVWQFNDPGERGNITPGGEGGFAILDSDEYGSSYSQDAGLRTPRMNFSGAASVILDFDTDYYSCCGSSVTVRVSADDGATWTNVWSYTDTSFNGHVTLDISAQAAGLSNVIVEFRYTAAWAWWWEIDDVVITPLGCELSPGGVVAGYVYDANDSSPIVAADVYSDMVATQTFFIPEDPASEGLYWVFHPVMGPPPINTQSLSGSNITFDPSAGGEAGYIPGVPTTLCFESNTYTNDNEWLYNTWLKFPSDWIISDTYVVGTPTCDAGYWGTFSGTFWETMPYEIGVYHQAVMGYTDHCIANYCVDVTPGASAGLVSWYYGGDYYAGTPHNPCSSDVYTPGSMVGSPCDESVNPQAYIPMIDGEEHDFTAEKDLYGSDTHTVSVYEDIVVQQDFSLGTGELAFNPTSFEVTMTVGDAPRTETLTISNLGSADVQFELVEKDEGFELPTVMIPAFAGKLPEETRPVSIGRAPEAGNRSSFQASGESPLSGLLAGEPAFAVDLDADSLMYIPDTTVPGTWNTIGTTMTSLFSGDFLAGDFSTLYAISYSDNNLYTVDTTTGAYTLVGPSTPPSVQSWTGLSGTPDGTLYGLTTDCSTSSHLVTVDPMTAAVTDLGNLSGIACGIDLAYNTNDGMIYIVDLISDVLFKVDPATTSVYYVGLTGVAANFAQGMDFEDESGVLYWAAYTTQGELRILDTSTGASSLVGVFPAGDEVDCLAFATGGQSDVPWLSENPISGTVPGAGSIGVDVIFDPTTAGLTQPGDYLAELKVKHDTPFTYPNIPVTLHLMAPGDFGTFDGHVWGYEACDVNPAVLEGATVNFWQGTSIVDTTTTNSAGYYSHTLPAGTYDIEFIMDGFVTDFAEEVILATGETLTVDFTLRLIAPCISVDPTSLEQTQTADTTSSQTLTIMNTGAGDGVFELFEMEATSLHADVELILDDGTVDNNIGIGGTWEFIWVNRFTPDPAAFPFNLNQIQVYFDSTGLGLVGDDITLVVYENVTGNTDPAIGSNFLYSWNTTIQALDAWNIYDLPAPVALNGPGDVIIGVIGLEVPGTSYWPAAIDQTTTQSRSWAGWWLASPPPSPAFLPPDDTWILVDSYFPGNWMVRGMGGSAAGDVIWLSLSPTAGLISADSSTDVTVTYDSTGLAGGDYLAAIQVKNPAAAAINVPVTLHVTDVRNLYLPMILR